MSANATDNHQAASGNQQEPDPAAARDRLLSIETEINSAFYEREREVRGLLLALLAREHVLLLGPPGAAKSELAREVCSRTQSEDSSADTGDGSTDGGYFWWLLSRTSAPEELFGPVSIKALENDSYRRKTAGKLPEARVAFLDEIFKANSAVLNGLLSVLNERVFHNDGQAHDVPLEMTVGASNELPADREELTAVYDRFLLRYEVAYIKEDASFEKVLASAGGTSTGATPTTITAAELGAARDQVGRTATSAVVSEVSALRRELAQAGIAVSDRRYARAMALLSANAYLEGRAEAGAEDLAVLADVLWSEPAQAKQVRQKVMECANPQLHAAQDLTDEAEEVHAQAMDAPEESATQQGTEANNKLKSITDRLLDLQREAAAAGRSTQRIDETLAKVRTMNKEVLDKCLGIDL